MLVAFVLQGPQIAPDALALVETMQHAYRNVRSLRCTLTHFPFSDETTHVVYRRSGGLLIQRLSAKSSVRVEYRVQDGKALISSPGTPRYLRALLGPDEGPFGALMSRVPHAGVPFGPMLDGGPFVPPDELTPRPSPDRIEVRLVSLNLGSRATTADGTPVDTLIVDRSLVDTWMHVPRPVRQRTLYQVGMADHLIRRVADADNDPSSLLAFRGGGRIDGIEIRNLVVDAPISDAEFRFRSAGGSVAMAPPRHDSLSGGSPRESWCPQGALIDLQSLSFVDQLTIGRFDAAGRSLSERRATIQFDVRRPGFLWGELVWNEAPGKEELGNEEPGNALVKREFAISDGRTLMTQRGRQDLTVFGPDAWSHPMASFGEGREFAVAPAATGILRQWSRSDSTLFEGLRPGPSRVIEGKRYDVFEWINDVVDEFGIPLGVANYKRFFIDPKDLLVRRYESQEMQGDFAGHPVITGWRRMTERFTKVVPNAKIDAKRFMVPPP